MIRNILSLYILHRINRTFFSAKWLLTVSALFVTNGGNLSLTNFRPTAAYIPSPLVDLLPVHQDTWTNHLFNPSSQLFQGDVNISIGHPTMCTKASLNATTYRTSHQINETGCSINFIFLFLYNVYRLPSSNVIWDWLQQPPCPVAQPLCMIKR